MARVKLPTILRSHAGGEKQVEVDGATLREVLSDLETRYPGITSTVLTDDGALHRFVNVYLFQLAKTGVADARIKGLWVNAPTQAIDMTGVYWAE